jgi:hypothetical protein
MMAVRLAEEMERMMVVGRKEIIEVISTMSNLYKQSHMTLFITFGLH